MLSTAEIDEHPENIEGLEGLDPSWEINYNELEFGNELARGNFGAVSIANYLGTKVAVKRLFDLDDEMKIYMQRELNVLKQIRHPNVVQFLGLSKSKDALYLITEFLPRGDLSRLLYDLKNTELESWKLRLQVDIQAAQGLAYVHAKRLIHRDIKAANFLVNDNWHIKLCDFGFSRSVTAAAPSTKGAKQQPGNQMTLCGTDEWMAPETMMGLDYNQTADVFSFGVFLSEMIFRAEPRQRSPGQGFRFDVAAFQKALPVDCPRGMAEVVLSATAYEPSQRPSMKVVLQKLQDLDKVYVETAKPAASTTINVTLVASGGVNAPLTATATAVTAAPTPVLPLAPTPTPATPAHPDAHAHAHIQTHATTSTSPSNGKSGGGGDDSSSSSSSSRDADKGMQTTKMDPKDVKSDKPASKDRLTKSKKKATKSGGGDGHHHKSKSADKDTDDSKRRDKESKSRDSKDRAKKDDKKKDAKPPKDAKGDDTKKDKTDKTK